MYELFPIDPSLRHILSADGDPPADGGSAGAGGGDPLAGAGGAPDPNNPPGGAPAAAGGASPQGGWTQEAYEKQIGRQHRRNKELETEVERLKGIEAENARLRELAAAAVIRPGAQPAAGAPPAQPAAPSAPAAPAAPAQPTMSEAQIREDERRKDGIRRLGESIDNTAEYAKLWPEVQENFKKIGQLPVELMDQILATDDPAYVMITLGKDPVKLQQALDMAGPRRQAVLLKIAMEKAPAADPSKGKRPSGAPPPPTGLPGGGGGTQPTGHVDLYDPKMQMAGPPTPDGALIPRNLEADKFDEAWYAERQRQKRESTGRPWSIGGTAGPRR